jgi:hypothetical protein
MRLRGEWTIAFVLALSAAPCATAAAGAGQSEPTPEMTKLMQNCDARKFETTIHVTGDGEPHDSRVRVCGVAGQSDADWIGTLKQIAGKTAANAEMPQAVKDQVLAALNGEIARLTALLPREAPAVAIPAPPIAEGFSTLPPLPAPPIAETYSTLPPLPAPIAAAPVQSSVAAASAPQLKLRCMVGRDVSLAEPCDSIERGNMLVVQADRDTASGVLLKFLRRGDERGELRLPSMRRGQPVAVAIPAEVCAGVERTRLEVRASAAPGAPEASFGPYDLSC